MVAAVHETGSEQAYGRTVPIRGRSTIQRLFLSLTRLTSLQSRILMVRAKITAMRIALYAALFAVAGVLGILALIFLYIGVFQVIAMYLATPWVFLIYGGAHVLIAGGLVWYATRLLQRRDEEPDDRDEAEREAEASTHGGVMQPEAMHE